jgi:MFS family permease
VSELLPAPPAIRFGTALVTLARQPAFWLLLVLNVLVGASNWLIYGWLPTYLREHFQLGLGKAGLSATGYLQAAAFGSVIVGGRWADRWAAVHPRGRMFVPAVGYLFAAPALYLMASTDTFATAIGALLLFGFGKGFYDANLMPILRQVVDERYSATGYGIFNCTSCFAGGIMTLLGGVMRDQHMDLALVFQGTAGGVFIAGLLLLAVRPRPPLASNM